MVGFLRWWELLLTSGLSPATKLVGATLGRHTTGDTGRGAYPSQLLLAALTGYGTDHVSDSLRALRAAGWVRRVRLGSAHGQVADEYVLTVPPGYRQRTTDELTAAHLTRKPGRGGARKRRAPKPEEELTRTGVRVSETAHPDWSPGEEEGLTRTGVPVSPTAQPDWSPLLNRTGVRPTSSVPPQQQQPREEANGSSDSGVPSDRPAVASDSEAGDLVAEHLAACHADPRPDLSRSALDLAERHTRAALETYPAAQVRAGLAAARAGRWRSLSAAVRQLPDLIAEAPAVGQPQRQLQPWEL